jgi:hypothetical protein
MATPATALQPDITQANTTIAALESRLQSLHQDMVADQYEAGDILSELRDRFPHGQWGVYLKQLCKRINLSERATRYYIETFEQLQKVGGSPVVAAAKELNLNPNKKPVRIALVDASEKHPDATPVELANFAKIELEARQDARTNKKKFKNPAIHQLAGLRKKYPTVQIERVGGSDMNSFQVWADVNAHDAPKGKGKIMVELTTDQLRTVKGVVRVGANGLEYSGVKRFLSAWGVGGVGGAK